MSSLANQYQCETYYQAAIHIAICLWRLSDVPYGLADELELIDKKDIPSNEKLRQVSYIGFWYLSPVSH